MSDMSPELSDSQKKLALDAKLVKFCAESVIEDENAKMIRKRMNRKNNDIFHGRYRFKKRKGQSRIMLQKSAIIVEQFKASLDEAVQKVDVEEYGGFKDPDGIFIPEVVNGIFRLYLDKAQFDMIGLDAIETIANEGQVALKIGGVMEDDFQGKPYWCPKIWLTPFLDFYRDPHADSPLYTIGKTTIDKHTLIALAKEANSGYDLECIKELNAGTDKDLADKDQNAGNPSTTVQKRRKQIILHEIYCTPLDEEGNVLKGVDGKELKNVVYTVANSQKVIRGPLKNPKWHNKAPYVVGQALRSPGATYPRAPMDAASDLSIALSELFNLMVDGGMASVFGVRQVRPDLLKNRAQVNEGLSSQATLILKDDVPEGANVVEQVATGKAPNDILPFFNILQSMVAEQSLMNDPAIGSVGGREELATKLVQAGSAVTKVLESMAVTIARTLSEPMAVMLWSEILQNVKKFPEDDLIRIIARDIDDFERASQIVQQLNAMTPKQRYEKGFKGFKFKGISELTHVKRMKELQSFQTFAQMAFSTPDMAQEFKKDYSITRYLGQVAEKLGIDRESIELTDREKKMADEIAKIREQALVQNEMEGNQNAGAGNAGSAQAPQADPTGTQPGPQ